jgi:hypothetical protein
MGLTATHRQNLSAEVATPDRFTSKSIWASFPVRDALDDFTRYSRWEDDFTNVPALTSATTAVNRHPYMSYIDTSDTIVALSTTKMIGVLRLSVAATDNNAPVVTLAGDAGVCAVISDTAGDDMPLWFESRWRKNSILDNECAMFLGLCEEARAVNNGLLVDDTGVLADIDHIGFNVAQDNGEELNFAFTKSGQTDVEVMAALDTLVVDTWYKSGFHYNPLADTAQRIKIFQNSVTQTSYVTGTQIAAATFPDAEELTMAAGAKAGAATAVALDLDWWRFAQKMRET